MHSDQLLTVAKEVGQERARPTISNFKVGAAFYLSNGVVVGGANTEDLATVAGACAERNALGAANARYGPLSVYGKDGIAWEQAAVWAKTPGPITPCGICRDVMAATSLDRGAEVFSQCEGPTRAIFAIGELLPLAGRGPGGDVREEIELWRLNGGRISEVTSPGNNALLESARAAAERSYLPPSFSSQPAAGAALLTSVGEVFTGAVGFDATLRLLGGAVSTAARKVVDGPFESTPRIVAVGLFTKGDVLRAPTGCDLQLLQEVRAEHGDVDVFFACDTSAYQTSLDALLPHAFGRRDLGY